LSNATPSSTRKLTLRSLAGERWDLPRLGARLCGVTGVLLVILGLRLDQAVRTAYASDWTGRATGTRARPADGCLGCRLPDSGWIWLHAIAAGLGIVLLLLAVRLSRRTKKGHATTAATVRVLSVVVLGAVVGAVVFRVLADTDTAVAGRGIGFAQLFDLAAFVALALIVVVAEGVRSSDGAATGLTAAALRSFLQRHRVNVAGVVFFAVLLTVVGQTSGQAIDSVRSWMVGDDLSRLSFGLATSILLAVIVYESSVRLTATQKRFQSMTSRTAIDAKRFLIVGGALLGVGFLARWPFFAERRLDFVLPLGSGIAVLGGLLAILGGLSLIRGQEEAGKQPAARTSDEPGPIEGNDQDDESALEWIAVIPLLAISAITIAAGIEAGLSDGRTFRMSSWNVLVPGLVLAGVAVLMTGDGKSPNLRPIKRRRRTKLWNRVTIGLLLLALLLATVALLLRQSGNAAAAVGFFLLLAMLLYVLVLFHGSPDVIAAGGRWMLALPIAAGGGLVTAVAVHLDVHSVADGLGVFGIVNVALASILSVLHYLVDWSLRRRPPPLLEQHGLRGIPVLTILFIWWIGAGLIAPPKTIDDARIVDRVAVAPKTASSLPKVGLAGPTLDQAFDVWVAAQGDDLTRNLSGLEIQPVPLILVAAHGGGIRAAYWAALALDCVVGKEAGRNPAADGRSAEDNLEANYEARCTENRRSPEERGLAARRIFLMSGVSGGAVGLYAYARQLLMTGDLDEGWVERLLGGDFASDTIAWSLFHDLPNHLIGFNSKTGGECRFKIHGQCFTQDRAAVLEETFDRKKPKSESNVARGADPYLRQAWDMRLSKNADEAGRAALVPVIVDNSTVTGGRTRAVTSAVQLSNWPGEELSEERAEIADERYMGDLHPLAANAEVRAALCTNHDIRLSTAAVLASRFPYVNPSGRLNGKCKPANGQNATETVGGTTKKPMKRMTCVDVDETDCEMELVDGGYTDNSGLFTVDAVLPTIRRLVTDYNAKRTNRRKIAIVVLELDNHYRASVGKPPSAAGGSEQSLIPLTTALGGRSAIETYARALAYRLVPPGCAVTISPGLHPGLAAPLGWELSEGARADLRTALVRPRQNLDPDDALQPISLLQRLQGWLSPGSTAPNIKELGDCIPRR
jgi:hypothetical protein